MRRVGTSFERAGCGGSDCNEGSDGEKGREADEHRFSGRVDGLDCSRSDGMLFADGELFCDLLFYTERVLLPLPLHIARSPSTDVDAKRSGVPTCYSVTARQQGEKKQVCHGLVGVVAG